MFEFDVIKDGCNKTGVTACSETGIATNDSLMIPISKLCETQTQQALFTDYNLHGIKQQHMRPVTHPSTQTIHTQRRTRTVIYDNICVNRQLFGH